MSIRNFGAIGLALLCLDNIAFAQSTNPPAKTPMNGEIVKTTPPLEPKSKGNP